MAGIELRRLRKSYGAFEAIPAIDLTIEDGEFCIFVGPSGCGKSTLLRTIAGLEDASAGEILIGGEEVSQRHPGERGAAMVFQNYALYPHMTVRQNMGYALKIAKKPKEEIKATVERAARTLGLEDLLERKPSELSGGQRQRVAIGRAIVRDPKVFLFDEPLSNLDAELRTRMRLELADLHRTLGVTMVYVTHDQVEAMTLADRIVVLRSGRIEQVGSPLDLYDNPENLFVARFIGSPSMNLLKAEAEADGIRLTGIDCPPLPRPDFVPAAWRGPLGIRPEHLRLGAGGTEVRLRAVEHLGGVTYGYATLADGTEFCVDLQGHRTTAAGDSVALAIPTERAFFFDQKTERRLR
ncbi:sn-glycerol-3-phosphate ABC transporter ATP-binding protein UgpC (plasmid) [Martelella lutilitoris]|uniref:sn-glycerol-3-phosphate ABC transporter ATP-binding protein UgpC n=1 Tax=Martelella lutilitoris TaxID=2583532 RepID=A0A7T7HPR1_9HYPH|nr:sn-glycerol-3-phosphate ABC transporter ATP-binding protein UgpC [Martelella lutilitoris]QQM33105.1 sn-glycerol-3-phosphate ABC transporter ATP-binding protein UgpC [Martelella lutilitoris]QRX65255.1 sn-glycerol-3-phosphate ABC transporter ATP-binding protein UgpC [Dysgonomonadaceae bacterium zrk40]